MLSSNPVHGDVYSNPVHGDVYSNPVHGDVYSNPVHGNVYSNPVHGEVYSNPVHGDVYSNPVHGEVYSNPVHGDVYSNPVHGDVYSIQHYAMKFVSDLRQVGGFLWFSSTIYTYHHDITEILLKVELSTINQHCLSQVFCGVCVAQSLVFCVVFCK